MERINRKNSLRTITARDAMRRQIIRLEPNKTIDHAINILIKYKVNALLVVDSNGTPVGVVSKTDIMGAYYAGLSTEASLDTIMVSPALFCQPSDSLETVLERMRINGVYRLYVADADSTTLSGTLAYPDIVGLLYKYCHQCEYSQLNIIKQSTAEDNALRISVRQVMTTMVKSVGADVEVGRVMENLSAYRFGAILVRGENDLPCGVISKTDLALNYKHGVQPDVAAREVMSRQIHSCEAGSLLEAAIIKMAVADVHRLFVYDGPVSNIVGVVSLTDAARARSGSCHACVSSRIKVEDYS